MNTRLTFLGIFGLLFCLVHSVRAADRSHCPNCYTVLDRHQAAVEIKNLKDHPISSPQDLAKHTAKIRNVDILTVPANYGNGVPASGRPHGPLQLDKIIVDR